MSIQKMSREQIDEALGKLAETKYSYKDLRIAACCYSPAIRSYMKEECVCDGCNRPFNFHIYAYNNDPMISRYQNLAKDFRSLGYDASVKFYCIDCVKKETGLLAPIVFSFRINDMEKPVLSYPDYTEYNDQDYRLALDFLKGIISSELLERYDIEENGCVYADKIRRIIGPLDKPCKPPQDRREDESEYMCKYKFPPR